MEAEQRDAEGNAGGDGNANVCAGREARADLVRHLWFLVRRGFRAVRKKVRNETEKRMRKVVEANII